MPVLGPGQHSVAEYVAHAHENMNDSLWSMGGLQSWGWAIADLEAAARQAAANDMASLVQDITQLLEEARTVLVDKPMLLRCRDKVLPAQEPHEDVRACLDTIERNRSLRRTLHDRLIDVVFVQLELDHPETHPD